MFTPRIPMRTLETLCRALGTMLDSGVPVVKALNVVAKKTGDQRCRRVLREITAQVEVGHDISTACRDQAGYFPEMFCDLVAVSEQSGSLPEVLIHLANHYDNLLRMRRTFLAAIIWPIIQFVAAVLIIAAVIVILGWVASLNPNTKPTDTLGLGLIGVPGAILWLSVTFGSVALLLGTYFLMKKGFEQHRLLDGLLLSIPVVGKCMRSFAIARFSWAFYLTQNSGMAIVPSLTTALKATGNGAFQGMTKRMTGLVKEGEDLSTAFEQTGLFPEEYLHMVQVAETSGTVPETLNRLSPQFEDQARRSLMVLAAVMSWVVWIVVAVFIIFIIFSVMLTYIGMINDLANGKF